VGFRTQWHSSCDYLREIEALGIGNADAKLQHRNDRILFIELRSPVFANDCGGDHIMATKELNISNILEALASGAQDLQRGASAVKRGFDVLKEEVEHHGFDVDKAIRQTRRAVSETAASAVRESERFLKNANKNIVRPAEKRIRKAVREFIEPEPLIPTWAKVTLGLVAVGAAVYALSRMESVRDFARPMTEPIADLFDSAHEAVENFEAEV
jgi:hypothetical protein